MAEKRAAAASGVFGSDRGVDVLAAKQDGPDHIAPETNSQVADLLAALRTMRGDLVGRLVALHQVGGYVDHGLAGLLARIQGAIAAVAAEVA